jgi:hypothetical protein
MTSKLHFDIQHIYSYQIFDYPKHQTFPPSEQTFFDLTSSGKHSYPTSLKTNLQFIPAPSSFDIFGPYSLKGDPSTPLYLNLSFPRVQELYPVLCAHRVRIFKKGVRQWGFRLNCAPETGYLEFLIRLSVLWPLGSAKQFGGGV